MDSNQKSTSADEAATIGIRRMKTVEADKFSIRDGNAAR